MGCSSSSDPFNKQYSKCDHMIKEVEHIKMGMIDFDIKQSERFQRQLDRLKFLEKKLREEEMPKLEDIFLEQNRDTSVKDLPKKQEQYNILREKYRKVCDDDVGLAEDALKGLQNGLKNLKNEVIKENN